MEGDWTVKHPYCPSIWLQYWELIVDSLFLLISQFWARPLKWMEWAISITRQRLFVNHYHYDRTIWIAL